VEVERWVGELPPIRAYKTPPTVDRKDVRARS
jgi:hypothetical protein